MCIKALAVSIACTLCLAMASASHAQNRATYGACLNQGAVQGLTGNALRAFVDACMQRNANDPPESPSGGLLGRCTGEYCGGVTGNILPYEQAREQCWLQAMGDPTGTPQSRVTPYQICMAHRGWPFAQ